MDPETGSVFHAVIKMFPLALVRLKLTVFDWLNFSAAKDTCLQIQKKKRKKKSWKSKVSMKTPVEMKTSKRLPLDEVLTVR